MTEFVVIDIPSSYNAIFDQDWLYMMKGAASTLPQVIKFANPRGEDTLYGDQVASKHCYLTMISNKVAMKEVQLIEEEHKVLVDIGRDLETKVVEDMIRYKLDEPSLDHFFLI